MHTHPSHIRSNSAKPVSGNLIGSDNTLDYVRTAAADASRPEKPPTQISLQRECSPSAAEVDSHTIHAKDQPSQGSCSIEENISGEPPEITPHDLGFTPKSVRELQDHLDHDFHVFVWLNMCDDNVATKEQVKESRTNTVKLDRIDTGGLQRPVEQLLEEDLGEIDQFLTRQTSLTDRLSYRACPRVSRMEVYNMLAKHRARITGATGKDHKFREIYEKEVEVVNAAELLFRFFLPSCFEGPTVGKYWGALDRLLKVSD